MKSVTVLLTGCGAPGAYGIIKCLKKNGERDIRIIGVDMNQDAGAKDMVDTFYTVPAAKDDDFINKILQICLIEKVNIILPIVTRELMKFALNKQVSVMDPEILRIVNNKANLLLAMKKAGLKTPEFEVVNTLEELINACRNLGYPNKAICVKAAEGNGSRGVRILDPFVSRYRLFFDEKPNSMYISYEELIYILKEKKEIPQMIVMEYLSGSEYTLDVLADNGNIVSSVCRKGIEVVTSNMMSLIIEENISVFSICNEVTNKFKLEGNVGFDVLFDKNQKNPYIIEINPRLTGGIVADAAAGVNLTYLGIKKMLGEQLPECKPIIGTKMIRRYEEIFYSPQGEKIEW